MNSSENTVRTRAAARAARGAVALWLLGVCLPAPADVAMVHVDDAAVAEGNSGITTLNFPVRVTGDTRNRIVLTWSTADDGGAAHPATVGVDYQAMIAQVTALSGGGGALPVAIVGDTAEEADETFRVNVASAVAIGPVPSLHAPVTLTLAAGAGPQDVATADFNGDGLTDALIATGGLNAFTVLLNHTTPGATDPGFASPSVFAAGEPLAAAAADLNGDGRPDVVILSGAVEIFFNTAPTGAIIPSFGSEHDFEVGGSVAPGGPAIADFNGDGKLDIAVFRQGDNDVAVLLNTTALGAGAPGFAAPVDFAAGSQPAGIVAADFNGDGKPDLAVTNTLGNSISVLLNTTAPGAATPSFAAHVDLATGGAPGALAAADLNGDGRPDLVAGNGSDGSLSVLINATAPGAATPAFQARTNFAGQGARPYRIVARDLNGDGKPDLAVADGTGANLSVFVNQTAPAAAAASFAPRLDLPTGAGSFANALAAADFNGDGRPDLVATDFNGDRLQVLFNTSTLTSAATSFAAIVPFATGTRLIGLAQGDLNGDGKPDIVAVHQLGPSAVSVLLNTTAPNAVVTSYSQPVDFGAGGASAVVLCDVNRDGRLDIVTDGVKVYRNTTPIGAATPSFAAPVSFAAGGGGLATSVAAADFNGDGRTDIAASDTSGKVAVLLNTTVPGGAPSFAAAAAFNAGAQPFSVAAGDLNGDGRPDLAVADPGSASVWVLLNTTAPGAAARSFSAATNFTVADAAYSVQMGDFNGDGRLDLAVARRSAGRVSVLLNTTAAGASVPGFSAATDFAVGDAPVQAFVADLNADGRADIVSANENGNNVSLLLNTTAPGAAAPSFAPALSLAAGTGPQAIGFGDINGDGHPDLAVSNLGTGNVITLLNSQFLVTLDDAGAIGTITNDDGAASGGGGGGGGGALSASLLLALVIPGLLMRRRSGRRPR